MTPSLWAEIEADVASSARHFRHAAQLHARGGYDRDDLDGYAAGMALMHAMLAGYTSFEAALLRLLALLDEEPPKGGDWHADLLRRVGRPLPDRPALMPPDLLAAAGEARRFRHVSAHTYDDFDPDRATPAVRAGAMLAERLPALLDRWKADFDP